MGKIRHKRHAYHTAAPKLEGNETATYLQSSAETSSSSNTSNLDLPFPKVTNNIFGSVFIAPDVLDQRLVTCTPSRKKRKLAREALKRKDRTSLQEEFKEMLVTNKKLKKKDRQPVNSVFKVSSMSVEKKNELKKKVGVTHMESLMDALLSEKTDDSSIKRKRQTTKPSKVQAKEMSEDMDTFSKIMMNSEFVSDPFATISAHLKMKLEAERQKTQ